MESPIPGRRSHDEMDKMDISETFQAFLDSGALYLAFGAVFCIVLGIGAARRLFKGANKIKNLSD
jgi:hypothetical protein